MIGVGSNNVSIRDIVVLHVKLASLGTCPMQIKRKETKQNETKREEMRRDEPRRNEKK